MAVQERKIQHYKSNRIDRKAGQVCHRCQSAFQIWGGRTAGLYYGWPYVNWALNEYTCFSINLLSLILSVFSLSFVAGDSQFVVTLNDGNVISYYGPKRTSLLLPR